MSLLLAREPGPAYEVGLDAARKVHLYRLYQTRSYEGATFGGTDRSTDKAIIEKAFAFARQRLRFRGIPTLVPVSAARDAADPRAQRLPDILCIGEFLWARPVHDRSHMYSSATLVWFQDGFAPPIAEPVLAEMREIDWRRIAEDWSG